MSAASRVSESRQSSTSRRSRSSARRHRRKEGAGRTHAPEPKDIVSGSGLPLDPSVRRELEERLGHDFSRVRLHTGRDANALAEMLGADAVAVGQDIFFRAGAYQPGTTGGQRLLAHELLHTVQNPHGLGVLRAGRDVGAVSLPAQPVERDAERAAQESVRPSAAAEAQPAAAEQGTGVEQGHAHTPGWLRYATVNADRTRMELLDPATLVDRLANSIVRSLRGDLDDRSKRTRRQLARLPDELRDAVLDRLEVRLLGSEFERVLDFVEEIDADADEEDHSLEAPKVLPDPAEELWYRREVERQNAREERGRERRPGPAPGPEKEPSGREGAPGSTPQNGGTREDGGGRSGGGASPRGAPQGEATQEPQPDALSGAAGTGQRATAAPGRQDAEGQRPSGEQRTAGEQAAPDGQGATGKDGEQGAAGEGGEELGRQGVPVASEEESAAENRPSAVDALVAGRRSEDPDTAGAREFAGSPTAAGRDVRLPGRTSRLDGVRNQDLVPEEEAEEDPFGRTSRSEVEVGGGEKSAWDIKLQPEDFLPERDLDVSGVPTADELDPLSTATPPMPSFPAPPPTKADRVQAERDAEDAEDAAADAEAEREQEGTDPAAEPEPSVETEGTLDDERPDALDVERAAEVRLGTGTRSKDPKAGDDPKAGPVTAQTTVQEAPGTAAGDGEVGEKAAEEEKGTAAAGDKSGSAPERESPQAKGGTATAAEPTATDDRKPAPTAETAGRPAADSPQGASATGGPGTSSARDTHVSGGPNVDTPGGAGSKAAGEATSAPSRGGSVGGERAVRTDEPAKGPASAAAAAAKRPTPAAAKPEPAAATAASASKAEPAGRKSAPSVPSPTAKASGGAGSGAGGGGGGGAPRAKGTKDSPPAPNLSGMSPEAGLATASTLKPHRALEAMGGVGSAVDRTVGDEHGQLAAAPPSMDRPAGAPRTLQGKPKTDAPATYSQEAPKKSDAPEAEKAEVKGEKKPEGPIEAEKAEEPGAWQTFKMALGFGVGKVLSWVGFEVDAEELAAKFAGLPTKDEALKQAQAGNAPGVEMQGAAEDKAGEQDSAVDAKGRETLATGREDAARNMGEDQVYPDVPKERMEAKVPGEQGGKTAPPERGAKTGNVPPEAVSEVAEHERKPQFRAAFDEGEKGMAKGRQAKDRDTRTSQRKHKKQVDLEVQSNTAAQTAEREKAKRDVDKKRADWRKEQDDELDKLGTKKTAKREKVRKDVKDREEKTDKDVDNEKQASDQKIKDKADKAEQDAEKKKNDSVQESGNWVTKAFEWIKNKVIEIKNAIVRIIKDARDAVVGFIKNFKETVERWIDEARAFVVETIKNLINDLIELAKSVVRAIIDLAKRIGQIIASLVEAAIALVNKLADKLKQIIKDLLDALGKILSDILNVLKKALMDVVKAVVDAVIAVLDFALKLLKGLGEFMMIAVDFLSDPGGWLSGAKNSAVDGAKNHLFREVKSAVKEWFQAKIEEILGLSKAIFDKLIKGGITLAQIIKETWDAIVPMLPLIIGEIVITKVVAKLIPGAGWVMAVIDAIRTAIGALSEILRAMGAVLEWLRSVRRGGAGKLFAKAVAAGIVALLELAYEALLSGIGKYVAKVGRKFKAIAAKLGKKKGKGGDKGKAGAGADDRDGGKGDGGRRAKDGTKTKGQDPKKESEKGADGGPPVTVPTAARPKGDTRPTTKRDADKPGTRGPARDDGAATTSAPHGDKRPSEGDGDGPPKDKAAPARDKDAASRGEPDPRPTPPAKATPQPRAPERPKPDTDTPKPRSDRDTPDKPKGDRSKDDRDATPRRDGDKDGDKPRAKDGDRPRGKDAPNRNRSRPDKGRPDRTGPRSDKDAPRKSRPSKEEKDRRKKDEDSQDSKEDRLRKIVARLRPRLKQKLTKGIKRPVHRAYLAAQRAWYRLTALNDKGSNLFEDEAVLNPRKIVINGREIDSEPILRAVRDLEGEILKRAEKEATARGWSLNPQEKDGVKSMEMPNDMDMHHIIALQGMDNRPNTQIWSWGGIKTHRARLKGWFLRKYKDGKALTEEEGKTKYSDMEEKLAQHVEASSEALSSSPKAPRSIGPESIQDDIAMNNSLQLLERRRNPGHFIYATMQAELFGDISTLPKEQREKRFREVYRLNPMAPKGAPMGGALLKTKKYTRNIGQIEKEIRKHQEAAKKKGHSGALLTDPVAIRDYLAGPEAQKQEDLANVKARSDLTEEQKRAERKKINARFRDRYGALSKLEALHQGELLANREIKLLEEWVKEKASDMNVDDEVSEQQVQKELIAKIRAHFNRRFPPL